MAFLRARSRAAAAFLIVTVMAACPGCATVRSVKIPQAYSEVGLCAKCKHVMALDGLPDSLSCTCPTCGSPVTVQAAKTQFRRACVDRMNRRTAMSCLTVAMMAGSIAGSIYGIPIPPPPMDESTFKPYELPMVIECKQAAPATPGQTAPAVPPPPQLEPVTPPDTR